MNKKIKLIDSNKYLFEKLSKEQQAKKKEELKEKIKNAGKTSFEKIMSDFNNHIIRVPISSRIEKIIKFFDWFPPYESESEEESNDKSKLFKVQWTNPY